MISRQTAILASQRAATATFATAAKPAAKPTPQSFFNDAAALTSVDALKAKIATIPFVAQPAQPLLHRAIKIDLDRVPFWINNDEPQLKWVTSFAPEMTRAQSIWEQTNANYLTFFGPFGTVKTKSPFLTLYNPFTQHIELIPHPTQHQISPSKSTREHSEATINTISTKIQNTLVGCSFRYKRRLKLVGMGYKVSSVTASPNNASQRVLEFQLGRSHLIPFALPSTVTVKVQNKRGTVLRLYSSDYETLNRITMEIRKLKPPEIYTGKGVVFWGETVVRKEGKKK